MWKSTFGGAAIVLTPILQFVILGIWSWAAYPSRVLKDESRTSGHQPAQVSQTDKNIWPLFSLLFISVPAAYILFGITCSAVNGSTMRLEYPHGFVFHPISIWISFGLVFAIGVSFQLFADAYFKEKFPRNR